MEWSDIHDTDGKYQVSRSGIVKNKRGKILKITELKSGIKLIRMTHKKQMLVKIRDLVAQAFIEPDNSKTHIIHLDGDRGNSALSNLERATHRESIEHDISLDLFDLESASQNNAKLSWKDVFEIRRKYEENTLDTLFESIELKVCEQTIIDIIDYKTWLIQ